MYKRLLAYLSLAFYSISNQFINNNQNSEATYFVTLYKLADPTNGEAWYFSAIINARNGNSKLAADDLAKAADNGFNDTKRMLQQPEFQNLQPPVNFAAIEAKMKYELSVSVVSGYLIFRMIARHTLLTTVNTRVYNSSICINGYLLSEFFSIFFPKRLRVKHL
jgi:hypothetical protein